MNSRVAHIAKSLYSIKRKNAKQNVLVFPKSNAEYDEIAAKVVGRFDGKYILVCGQQYMTQLCVIFHKITR